MRIKQKTLRLFIVLSIVVGVTFTMFSTMSATSNPEDAPSDWAFDISSIELNNAIIEAYPAVDTDGDGFISISEANAMTGSLTLTNKGIKGTLNGIENFVSLTFLNLQQNAISGSLPENIGNLANLTLINLAQNKLTGEIPSSIGNLANLKNLNFTSNQLGGDIPSSIGNLTNLKYLDLRSNRNLTSIPKSIANLKQLTNFDVGLNRLTSLPEELSELSSLTSFHADANNGITNIPENIGNLVNLETLWLSSNKITKIPDSIVDLPKVVYFHLGNNNITSITQAQYDKLNEHWASGLKSQTSSKTLLKKGVVNHDYKFDALPAYEQFINYGLTFTYRLTTPEGLTSIITPVLANGSITIPALELPQIGEYTLVATGAGSRLDESVYTTKFSIDTPIEYISAEANGEEDVQTSSKITLTLSKDIDGLTIEDITLLPLTKAMTYINKNELVALGQGEYELFIDGTWNEGTKVNVTLSKEDLVFLPDTHLVTLHQKESIPTQEETGKPETNENNSSDIAVNHPINNTPQTGDRTMFTGFTTALIGSLVVVIASIKLRKEKQ